MADRDTRFRNEEQGHEAPARARPKELPDGEEGKPLGKSAGLAIPVYDYGDVETLTSVRYEVPPAAEGSSASGAEAPIIATSGEMVAQYEVIRPLGQGGMGQVYLARDTRLGRLAALKFLAIKNDKRAERFTAEARATARCSHENIVVIYDVSEHRGFPYMALEYLRGKTLRDWLMDRLPGRGPGRLPGRQAGHEPAPPLGQAPRDAGPTPAGATRAALSAYEAIDIILRVVRALVCAHDHGIIHRDLKPSNIMLTDSGAIKVLDFGVAKLMDHVELDETAEPPPPTPADLTATGTLLGTRLYMSPEQWGASAVDHRSDIWAVGILLYELLMGEHPLAHLSNAELAQVADLSVPMPRVRNLRPDIGPLATLIDRCLLKRKDDRIGSARELLDELQRITGALRMGRLDEDRAPYPGLSSFQESDAERFFGRSQDITMVTGRLAEEPLIAVVGPSGAGKSSFVRAGLIPALKRTEDAWEAYVMRPGPQPMAALAGLLVEHNWATMSAVTSQADAHRPATEDESSLIERLHHEPGYAGVQMRGRARRRLCRILLFIDQFEELYTLADARERQIFLKCLAGIADDAASPLRLVVSIRSDFLDCMSDLHKTLGALYRGLVFLPQIGHEGLREALVRPLEAIDYRFEDPATVDDMLHALAGASGALPLLQFTASKMWELRDRSSRTLTTASYRRIGGVAGTLAMYADEVLRSMSAAETALLRAIFLRLITPERTRAVISLAELRELATFDRVDQMVSRLVDARLVTVESGGSGSDATVEIVHESLINAWPALGQWLNESQEDMAFLTRLRNAAREWSASGKPDGMLWRERAADSARHWYERYQGDLRPAEREYLSAVFRLATQAQAQRRLIIAGAVSSLVVITAFMAYLAFREREASQRAASQAARAMDAAHLIAIRELEHDPTAMLAMLREIDQPEEARGWTNSVQYAQSAGVARAVLEGHQASVKGAWFSPSGAMVVTVSADHTARIWHLDQEENRDSLVLAGHTDAVVWAAFHPSGHRLATGSHDSTVRVWNVDGSGTPMVLRGHTDVVSWVAFIADGKRILSTSRDGTARIWDAENGAALAVLEGHTEAIYSAALSPDGRFMVTASADGSARVWPLGSDGAAAGNEAPIVLDGHGSIVWAAAFTPNGKRVVTVTNSGQVWIWNADGSAPPRHLVDHESPLWSVDVHPDGKRMVVCGSDGIAELWGLDSSAPITVLGGHSGKIHRATFSPDGAYILTAGDSGLQVFTENGAFATALRGHKAAVLWAEFHPRSGSVVTASGDQTARVWPIRGEKLPLITGKDHSDRVHVVVANEPMTRLITIPYVLEARVWDIGESGIPRLLSTHAGPLEHADFSRAKDRLLTVSRDGVLRVWNADGTTLLAELPKFEAVGRAWFMPDGERVVTISQQTKLTLWRLEPPRLHPIREKLLPGVAQALSPDGELIAALGQGQSLQQAQKTGQKPGQKPGKSGDLWLVSVDDDRTPIVLPLDPETKGRQCKISFRPDNTRILATCDDRLVRVLPIGSTGKPLLLSHPQPVGYAYFSHDGEHIVTTALDGAIRVWSLQDDDNNDGSSKSQPSLLVLRHSGLVLQEASLSSDDAYVIARSWAPELAIWSVAEPSTPMLISTSTAPHWLRFHSSRGRVIMVDTTSTIWTWNHVRPYSLRMSALWAATDYCMLPKQRIELLSVDEQTATAGLHACRRRVAEAAAAAQAAAASSP